MGNILTGAKRKKKCVAYRRKFIAVLVLLAAWQLLSMWVDREIFLPSFVNTTGSTIRNEIMVESHEVLTQSNTRITKEATGMDLTSCIKICKISPICAFISAITASSTPVMRDIYRYYGVTKKDMEESSDRYLTLVTILADSPAGRCCIKKWCKGKKKKERRGKH